MLEFTALSQMDIEHCTDSNILASCHFALFGKIPSLSESTGADTSWKRGQDLSFYCCYINCKFHIARIVQSLFYLNLILNKRNVSFFYLLHFFRLKPT